MDNFKITESYNGNFIVLENTIDKVIIDNELIIGISPYKDNTTCHITDSQGDEIELDADNLRATIESFIKINNIK